MNRMHASTLAGRGGASVRRTQCNAKQITFLGRTIIRCPWLVTGPAAVRRRPSAIHVLERIQPGTACDCVTSASHARDYYGNSMDAFCDVLVVDGQIDPQGLQPEPVRPADQEQNHITLDFQVNYDSKPCENVFIVGSAPGLGSWDVAKAIAMHWTGDGVWVTPRPVPLVAGQVVEYKYLVYNDAEASYHWQSGPNESVQLPVEDEGALWRVRDQWDESDHQLISRPGTDQAVEVLSSDLLPACVARIPAECFQCAQCVMPHIMSPSCPILRAKRASMQQAQQQAEEA